MGTVGNIASQLNNLSPCESSNCCQQIDALKSQIGALEQQLNSIDSRQQSLEQWVRGEIAKLTNSIGEVAASIDRKIDELLRYILGTIAALRDFLLGQLSGGNNALEPRVASLEERMSRRGLWEQDFTARFNELLARVGGLEAWKNAIENRIGGLEGLIRGIEGRVSSLEGWKNAIDSRLAGIDRQLGELSSRIDALGRRIDDGLADLRSLLDRAIAELGKQLDGIRDFIERRLAAIERQFADIIARIDAQIADIREFVQQEISRMAAFIRQKIDELIQLIYSLLGQSGTNSDLTYLERRVDILERMVDSINTRISNLPNLIQAAQNRISDLESRVSELFNRLRDTASSNLNMDEIRGLFSITWSLINQSSNNNNGAITLPKLDAILNLLADNAQKTTQVLSKVDLPMSGDTVLSDCGDGANNISLPYSGNGLTALSSQISSLSLALSQKLCNLETTTNDEEQEKRDKTLTNIYRILGGDAWIDSANQVRIYHDPERQIKAAATAHFNDNGISSKNMEAGSLIEWIQNMMAVDYYRSGHQELPGEVPETLLTIGSDTDRKIKNALDLQQWQIEQLDALLGQFPLEIEIKDTDPLKPGDQTKKLELGNISEVLAELMGMSFLTTQNTDLTINYLNRIGVETIAAKNAAIVAQDYAKANASYLGYDANPVKRKIPYALNPAGESIESVLNDTEGEVIGWENTDKSSAKDYFKRIFFVLGLIKESFFVRPKNLQRLADSLNMVRTQETEEASAKFQTDIGTINDPNSTFNSARRNDPSLPEVQVKIKNRK